MDTSTGITLHDDSEDGSDDEHDDPSKWERSPSPASSASHLAASFVQRVNAFVGGIVPKSPGGSLTDAEIEAEAERERDRSRREAEAILTKEAQQRKLVEERVLAMMETTKSLPPPPARPQTTTPNPPSPSNSQKESSWWLAAKNKLTPTKEPLTPAQQVILDAKARDKEKKGVSKGKGKEWPSNAQSKFTDPAFANLNIPVAPPQRRPVPSLSPSPTPSRPSLTNMPPNLSPSPMRTIDSLSSSPSREAPPVYAQFNPQGTLDISGTLLAVATRFEKLEKWTIGHVRALEDRMNNVERWLADKEKDKEEEASMKEEIKEISLQKLQEIQEEVSELQDRFGELGREMAKIATAPSNVSNGPKSQVASVSVSPQTVSSVVVQQKMETISPSTPHRLSSTTAVESTSPPISSTKTPSGTRLPYPQGDYTSPSDLFSPTNSPPDSINAAARTRPMPAPELPSTGLPSSTPPSFSSTPSSTETTSYIGGHSLPPKPLTDNINPTSTRIGSGTGLPPPRFTTQRQASISPTPRKRYTVALGSPVVSPDELSSNAAEPPRRAGTPKSFARPLSSFDNTFFSSTSGTSRRDGDDDTDFGGDEKIGKSTSARVMSSEMGDYKAANHSSPPPNRRLRTQSAYGFSNIAGSNTMAAPGDRNGTATSGMPSVAPLKLKVRSKSSERLYPGGGTGDGMVSALGGGAKFVDPLVLRKQSRDSVKVIAMPKPIGKVPIGQLVAFFDGDKNNKF